MTFDGTSVYVCSEIGLRRLLFARHELGTVLGSASVLQFFGDSVSSNTGETGKTGTKTSLNHS